MKKKIEVFGDEYTQYNEYTFYSTKQQKNFYPDRPVGSTARYFIKQGVDDVIYVLVEYDWKCILRNKWNGTPITEEYTLVEVTDARAFEDLREYGRYVYESEYTTPMADNVEEVSKLPRDIKKQLNRRGYKNTNIRCFLWYDENENPTRLDVLFLTAWYAKLVYVVFGLPFHAIMGGIGGLAEYCVNVKELYTELADGGHTSDVYYYNNPNDQESRDLIDKIMKYND